MPAGARILIWKRASQPVKCVVCIPRTMHLLLLVILFSEVTPAFVYWVTYSTVPRRYFNGRVPAGTLPGCSSEHSSPACPCRRPPASSPIKGSRDYPTNRYIYTAPVLGDQAVHSLQQQSLVRFGRRLYQHWALPFRAMIGFGRRLYQRGPYPFVLFGNKISHGMGYLCFTLENKISHGIMKYPMLLHLQGV